MDALSLAQNSHLQLVDQFVFGIFAAWNSAKLRRRPAEGQTVSRCPKLSQKKGAPVLVEVPSHLRLSSSNGILQHIVVLHRPIHRLSIDLVIVRGER
eukprot:764203-Hanusia_phi.AAC.3